MIRPHGSGIVTAVGLAVAMVLVSLPAPTGTTADEDLPGVPGATSGPWGAWTTERVDRFASDSETDIAYTPTGELRILYTKGYNGAFVARPAPNGWVSSFIEMQARLGGLAIADDGTEWVAYSRMGGNSLGLKVATRAAPSDAWSIDAVDPIGVEPDIALDTTGTVHIVYQEAIIDVTDRLRHVIRNPNGTYTNETIETIEEIHRPSMAVDSQDRVHVAWGTKKGSNFTVRYAVKDPSTGTWTFTWLDDCGYDFDGPSLAVDSQDKPHVACYAADQGLGYYHQDAQGQWVFETAASGSDVAPLRGNASVGLDPAITIGPRDEPHITFRTDYNPSFPDDPLSPAHLYYAALTAAGVWSVERVDGSGQGVGWASSVTTNTLGQPTVVYVNSWRFRVCCSVDQLNYFGDLHLAQSIVGI